MVTTPSPQLRVHARGVCVFSEKLTPWASACPTPHAKIMRKKPPHRA
jgi:hypothetical protein